MSDSCTIGPTDTFAAHPLPQTNTSAGLSNSPLLYTAQLYWASLVKGVVATSWDLRSTHWLPLAGHILRGPGYTSSFVGALCWNAGPCNASARTRRLGREPAEPVTDAAEVEPLGGRARSRRDYPCAALHQWSGDG
ncbi:hypothetical protein K466DRAFT_304708 [Polyporus arcularius HHB13444]|uniref:Uncharacterized protein n=1 Tax=Polyporus arcularius HHB13444 TaxID=1314778 RepID=A0A5C3P0I3_9APHY|nr:hypothetical protein K466DRAFT_304708 [Polyporus arcularius HHB13444]